MNVQSLLVASIATSIFMASCQPASVFQPITASGYEYFHHVKNDGSQPIEGDYAYCYIDMRNGDKVIQSNRSAGKLAKLKIAETTEGVQNSPVVDALQLMTIGDSLTVHYPLAGKKPKGFEDANFIAYDIKLIDIKSSAEYKAEFKSKWKKATASLN